MDVILDFIGAPYFTPNIKSLKLDGRLSMQGFMGGNVAEKVNLGTLLTKRLRVEGSTLRSRSLEYQSKLVQEFFHSGGLDTIERGASSSESNADGWRTASWCTRCLTGTTSRMRTTRWLPTRVRLTVGGVHADNDRHWQE